VYLFKILLHRAWSPFHVNLYLSYLYHLNCLELDLLVLAVHFLIVLHCHLMLGLLTSIHNYLLLIGEILPKWTPMRLLENTAYQLRIVTFHYFIPVYFLLNHA
jgi:hypothetical protein